MAENKVDVYCRKCGNNTHHTICHSEEISERDEYAFDEIFSIVKCDGCSTYSFLYRYFDIEGAFPISNDEWTVPETRDVYPRSIENHKDLEDEYFLPSIVTKIYTEALTAYKEKAYILASLGFRAIVEAICNDQKIEGRTLEKRINNMVIKGLISRNDAKRLHAVRFMGNDAAHEIIEPKPESLSIVLKIIEGLLLSIYIYDAEASGRIDTLIDNFDEFLKCIELNLITREKGSELPLQKILGKDIRRLIEREKLENQLISMIQNNKYLKLSLGKKDKYFNSSKEFQYYIIN